MWYQRFFIFKEISERCSTNNLSQCMIYPQPISFSSFTLWTFSWLCYINLHRKVFYQKLRAWRFKGGTTCGDIISGSLYLFFLLQFWLRKFILLEVLLGEERHTGIKRNLVITSINCNLCKCKVDLWIKSFWLFFYLKKKGIKS